jgi:hypothetical protein
MTKITNFVWDPVNDCVISELNGTGAVQAVYTHEPRQYGRVLSQRRGTTSHFHHHDALGSTRFLTDSSGNVTDTYLNDAWGNSVAQTGTTINPFRWVGKYGYYTDNATAQVYVRVRMYQPTTARWTSTKAKGGKITPSTDYRLSPIPHQQESNSSRQNALQQSYYRRIATSSLPCSQDDPCPCKNSDAGCRFNIELRGTLHTLPFLVSDLQLVLAYTPTIPLIAPPLPPQPNRKDDECFGDYGRTNRGTIEVETSNGTVCRYNASNFNDPFGYPEEGTISEECRIIFSKPHGSRPPYGTPPYYQAGSIYQFLVDIARITIDFDIELFCGCGPMDKLSRPTTRAAGTLSVKLNIP